jgi:hypothetical protein
MIPSLNLNWAWKNIHENHIETKPLHLSTAFVAGCFFQFITMSAVSCMIDSDRLFYGILVGAVLPVTGLCFLRVYKSTSVSENPKLSPRKHEKRKSQEVTNG